MTGVRVVTSAEATVTFTTTNDANAATSTADAATRRADRGVIAPELSERAAEP